MLVNERNPRVLAATRAGGPINTIGALLRVRTTSRLNQAD